MTGQDQQARTSAGAQKHVGRVRSREASRLHHGGRPVVKSKPSRRERDLAVWAKDGADEQRSQRACPSGASAAGSRAERAVARGRPERPRAPAARAHALADHNWPSRDRQSGPRKMRTPERLSGPPGIGHLRRTCTVWSVFHDAGATGRRDRTWCQAGGVVHTRNEARSWSTIRTPARKRVAMSWMTLSRMKKWAWRVQDWAACSGRRQSDNPGRS